MLRIETGCLATLNKACYSLVCVEISARRMGSHVVEKGNVYDSSRVADIFSACFRWRTGRDDNKCEMIMIWAEGDEGNGE